VKRKDDAGKKEGPAPFDPDEDVPPGDYVLEVEKSPDTAD
jgi:hypothetical protein